MKNKNNLTILIITLPLLLSGCKKYLNEDYLTSEEIHEYGWAGKSPAHRPKRLYCYETIGGPDCYRDPQPGREERLINAYDVEKDERDIIRVEEQATYVYSPDEEHNFF
ncbi:MAG: hypothetical protein ACPGXY_06295 [Alphaproteobacteria bacterium]